MTLGAVPAARLLFSDGERFEVTARDLDLDLDRNDRVFDNLDGFSIVDVSIADSHAGPFDLTSFELERDGEGPYRMTATGTTTPDELVDYGVEGLSLPGGSIFDSAMQLLGIRHHRHAADRPRHGADVGRRPGPGRLRRRRDRRHPTGPLAELLTNAIVVQL